MDYHKFPDADNFEYIQKCSLEMTSAGQTKARFTLDAPVGGPAAGRRGACKAAACLSRFEDDVYHLGFSGSRWAANGSQFPLTPPAPCSGQNTARTTLTLDDQLGLELKDARGRVLLRTSPGRAFGVCGAESIFLFEHSPDFQYYGMGEKLLGLELSGRRTKFWNTDIWADFHYDVHRQGEPDPAYVSIPYVIIKRGNTYLGLLIDNPYPSFMFTGVSVSSMGPAQAGLRTPRVLGMGTQAGLPSLYILYGPSLPELTRKLQRLVGCTPLPPAWALGYHQCRWGYQSAKDLLWLDESFRQHKVPCDGLWLDIEYMDGYRVFTFDKKNFPDPAAALAQMEKRGRKVVPIIDPGVKAEPGYPVFDTGQRDDVFCQTPQGQPFIGHVWPGRTAFPDFSLPACRRWWADLVARFASAGLHGAWLDMNDPATGPVALDAMRFDHGRLDHEWYHNQYAAGMARASREGFLQAHPGQRPLLISRSGFTGVSRYVGLWTGDNHSNYYYLKMAIATTLNLALSGVPFNGCDVGGFAGDTHARLLEDWMKACFLFPLCRNHSTYGTRAQEPWAFGPKTLTLLRDYIRLRYRLRPYLYNLFIDQEERGEAILRPLFYDFADKPSLPLGKIDDQFMVGPWLMQAPFVEEKAVRRQVVLPQARWYSLHDAKWMQGGRTVGVQRHPRLTPLYVREGAILPLAPPVEAENDFQPRTIECHLFLRPSSKMTTRYVYVYDDGQTFAYQQGERSALEIVARSDGRGGLTIQTRQLTQGYGPCQMSFVLYDAFKSVRIKDGQGEHTAKVRPAKWSFAGRAQKVWRISC